MKGTKQAEAIRDGLELVADGLSFPTSLTFDPDGVAYVAESGLPFGGAPAGGRVWRLDRRAGAASRTLLAQGLQPPVNGLTFHNGALYVSEAGRIGRLEMDGRHIPVIDNLPGPGNYHTNMVAFGPEGKLYFSQGAMTNMGIVGLDAYELGWLRRLPHAHDIPGHDVVLAGVNVETEDPLAGTGARCITGAFVPFGTPGQGGRRIAGRLPFTAGIMRCDSDGRGLEAVAWGLRNAYGLGFLPDGRLLATDQGADDRGSRPVGAAPDLLFEVRPGAWYGWPDFIGGDPITDPRYRPARGPAPQFVLARHNQLPPPQKPLLRFPANAAAVKFDVAPAGREHAGHVFVALFGDEKPMTAPSGAPAGRAVVQVDPAHWTIHPALAGSPLSRPIDIRFGPRDSALYVLDFGHFEMTAAGGTGSVLATPGTGRLWRWRNWDRSATSEGADFGC